MSFGFPHHLAQYDMLTIYSLVVDVLQPYTLGMLLVCACLARLWWTNPSRPTGFRLLMIATGMLFVVSTPLAAHFAAMAFESEHPRTEVPSKSAQAIVVLAAGVVPPDDVHPKSRLTDGTLRRCLRGVEVFAHNPQALIFVSGGKVRPNQPGPATAEPMSQMLKQLGVPENRIVVEANSTDTFENAANTARLLEEYGLQRVVLVTDAIHMPRAVRCFAKHDVQVTAAGCSYYSTRLDISPLMVLPRLDALEVQTRIVRELLANTWYALRGKL